MKALVTNQLANNYTRYGIFATDDIPDVAIDDFTYLIQVEFWYLDKCEISKSVTQTSNTTRVIGNKVIGKVLDVPSHFSKYKKGDSVLVESKDLNNGLFRRQISVKETQILELNYQLETKLDCIEKVLDIFDILRIMRRNESSGFKGSWVNASQFF